MGITGAICWIFKPLSFESNKNSNEVRNYSNYQKKFWESKKRIHRKSPFHPVITAFSWPKIQFAQKYITINPKTTLLDVGCGNGYFTVNWAKICNTTGLQNAHGLYVVDSSC